MNKKYESMNNIGLMAQDVGQAILESYSRVMESLAFNVLARIDDLIYINDATKQHAKYLFGEERLGVLY